MPMEVSVCLYVANLKGKKVNRTLMFLIRKNEKKKKKLGKWLK